MLIYWTDKYQSSQHNLTQYLYPLALRLNKVNLFDYYLFAFFYVNYVNLSTLFIIDDYLN